VLAATLAAVSAPGCRKPTPPEPSSVNGPRESYINTICAFVATPDDTLTEPVRLRFDWGDGDTSAWGDELTAGQADTAYHFWTALGTYLVSSQVQDPDGALSDWSAPGTLAIVNRAPPAPRILEAEKTGYADTGLVDSCSSYRIVANDPDGESLSYRMTWAEGETTAWTAPTSPSTWQTFSHAWTGYGTFSVLAQARDPHGTLSEWSPAVNVTIFLPPPSLKWKYSNGMSILSAPAIGHDGAVYFGSDDNCLHCLNPDGSVRWTYATKGNIVIPPVIGADGTVYTGARETFVCAVRPNGAVRWQVNVRKYIRSAPAIGADGTVLVAYYNDSVLALNSDGTTAWQCSTYKGSKYSVSIGPDGTVYAPISSEDLIAITPDSALQWRDTNCARFSVAINADGTIYAATRGWLSAISPDGSVLWRCPVSGCSMAEPIIGPDGTIYVGGKGSQLFACSPAGVLLWSVDLGAGIRSEAPTLLADGTLLVTLSNGCLCAPNAADGRLKWRFHTNTGDPTAPNVGPDGTIYVGTARGDFFALAGTSLLADSPWPKYRHDAQNTGRADGPWPRRH
jgi:outer membrane protein assembly factor BamB